MSSSLPEPRSKRRSRRLRVFAGVTVMALATAGPALADNDHADTQKVLNAFQKHAGPGAAVYAGNRTSSWNLHAGTGDIKASKPIQPDERFRIASQTKTFTAVVVFQLVEEDRVELDAPIERYLPGVVAGNGYDGNKITVRHLLQQTSGIPTYNPTSVGRTTIEAQVRAALANPPASEPGTRFAYSNANYWILGLLVERLTGKSAQDAITDRIITPLDLTQTKYPAAGENRLEAPLVRGYVGRRVGPIFAWADVTHSAEPSAWSTAGAVVSTLNDVAKFYQALLDGKVISSTALAEMQKTIPFPFPGVEYGLGLMRFPLTCGGYAWGHAGDLWGYSSATAATSDGRRASVVANTTGLPQQKPDRIDILDSALCGTETG